MIDHEPETKSKKYQKIDLTSEITSKMDADNVKNNNDILLKV